MLAKEFCHRDTEDTEEKGKTIREILGGLNQNKIIEWGCIGDYGRHLQAETAMGLTVAFEIFQAIFQLNAALLEEGVEFHACLEAQQAAQLRSGELAGAVGFERQRLDGGARQVLALDRESRQEFVWKGDGDVLHGFRIPEE